MLIRLRHRAWASSWLSYLLMLPLLLSSFGVPASTHTSLAHASKNTAHATHCQQSAATSGAEKSGVTEPDCCKDGGCICSFLTQTILSNPPLAFGASLPPSRVFVPLQSPPLPALALANLLRPPIA